MAHQMGRLAKYHQERGDSKNITWGLVWGINATYKWPDADKFKDVFRVAPVQDNDLREAGGRYITVNDELTDRDVKTFLDGIAGALNKLPAWLITRHNGFDDPNCKYNGYHWHAVMLGKVNPKRDSRWGKHASMLSQITRKTYFAQEPAESAVALTSHICKAPRELVGENMTFYKEILDEKDKRDAERIALDALDDQSMSPTWTKAKLKEDVNYHRITNLVKLMQKYNSQEVNELKQKLLAVPKDWDTFRQLMCLPSFDVMIKKAVELYRAEEVCKPIWDRFNKATTMTSAAETDTYMSYADSCMWYDKWIEHQGFDGTQFTEAVFDVLSRRHRKKNTLMLEGEPNSGKSWIIRSILPHYKYWGECHGVGGGGYAFAWQSCLETGLIMMEEPMLDPTTIEQAKLILEGAPTYIKVKCKQDALLRPTPVFITSNNPLWKWCSSARGALTERMFHFRCKSMRDLKGVTKLLNPYLWVNKYVHYAQANKLPYYALTGVGIGTLINGEVLVDAKLTCDEDIEDIDADTEEFIRQAEEKHKREMEIVRKKAALKRKLDFANIKGFINSDEEARTTMDLGEPDTIVIKWAKNSPSHESEFPLTQEQSLKLTLEESDDENTQL
uniref:Nonstructural protein n=1 Tax=Tarsiger cyanurus parvoviridae sp. TaxID=2794540 RepID=A0A8A4XDW0_9VIRU|nr:MAG: nonstructural protein [Tarsiger cyanurus parvoviridae sp.]